ARRAHPIGAPAPQRPPRRGPGDPRAASSRPGDDASAHDPRVAAMKVDRRRFFTRSALAFGAVATGEFAAASAAQAPRAEAAPAAASLGEFVPFDGPHQAGVLTEPRDAVV